MSEEQPSRWRWILPLMVGVLFGGLGGSVFTWWINRPKPTVVTYRVVSTALADPQATGLIPDLRVLIGAEPIQELYAHTVELVPRQGPFAERAEFAVTFSKAVHVYGVTLDLPTALHKLSCARLEQAAGIPNKPENALTLGYNCQMSPVKAGTGPFAVVLATDSRETPKIEMVEKGIDLVAADQFAPQHPGQVEPLLLALLAGLFAGTVGYMGWGLWERIQRLDAAMKDMRDAVRSAKEAVNARVHRT
ncbi:MAG: hypothetical protein ABSC64_07175 [Candidatus Korobacteraceae bacterium]